MFLIKMTSLWILNPISQDILIKAPQGYLKQVSDRYISDGLLVILSYEIETKTSEVGSGVQKNHL
jgi:hypothetical protein